MIYKDSLYFSIATKMNLRENYLLSYEVIEEVATFFQQHFPIEIMFNYIDNKSVRLNKVTDNNKKKILQKLKDKEIHYFMIMERMTSKEYYDSSENQREITTLAFVIGFSVHSKDIWGISVAIPMEFLSENMIQNTVIPFFQNLHNKLDGINSYIHRGSCFDSMDFKCFDTLSLFPLNDSSVWESYVRGYHWGNVLNKRQIEKLGGIARIKKQGFYKVEDWNEDVYIQVTKNVDDYSMSDAKRIREFLLPILPPDKYRRQRYCIPPEETLVAFHIENFIFYEDYAE